MTGQPDPLTHDAAANTANSSAASTMRMTAAPVRLVVVSSKLASEAMVVSSEVRSSGSSKYDF